MPPEEEEVTPVPEDDSDLESIEATPVDGDEEKVVWKKSDVDRLRKEAAARRKQVRGYSHFDKAFENYTPQEVEWYLQAAKQLIVDPKKAVAQFKELISLYDADGGIPPSDSHPKKAGNDKKEGDKTVDSADKDEVRLTKAELTAMLEATKAQVVQETISREMRREAASLGFTDDHPGLALFLDFARKNNGDLKAAAKSYTDTVTAEATKLAEAKVAASEDFPRRGRGAGPVVPKGEVPKTFAEARAAAEALFAATPGN